MKKYYKKLPLPQNVVEKINLCQNYALPLQPPESYETNVTITGTDFSMYVYEEFPNIEYSQTDEKLNFALYKRNHLTIKGMKNEVFWSNQLFFLPATFALGTMLSFTAGIFANFMDWSAPLCFLGGVAITTVYSAVVLTECAMKKYTQKKAIKYNNLVKNYAKTPQVLRIIPEYSIPTD